MAFTRRVALVLIMLVASGCPWTFRPLGCWNGVLEPGEQCDPPVTGNQCGAGEVCKMGCSCAPPCDCCARNPRTLRIRHRPTEDVCGTVTSRDGAVIQNLGCGKVYLGGGGSTLTYPKLPEITTVLNVSSCNAATEKVVLSGTTAKETGSVSTCTSSNCGFGPPVAVANAIPALNMCLVMHFAHDAFGEMSCDGFASISLPIRAEFFLTGDTLPDHQPCPLCVNRSCRGGPNNGMACTPQTSRAGQAYPTSHDCPPDASVSIGQLAIQPTLTTGPATAEARDAGRQHRVFCGYCRDADNTDDFESPLKACAVTEEWCSGQFESCEQRSQGALGPGGGLAQMISLEGAPPGCLADGRPHPATVAAGWCAAPTTPSGPSFIDAAFDLPGPGAFTLRGDMELR